MTVAALKAEYAFNAVSGATCTGATGTAQLWAVYEEAPPAVQLGPVSTDQPMAWDELARAFMAATEPDYEPGERPRR